MQQVRKVAACTSKILLFVDYNDEIYPHSADGIPPRVFGAQQASWQDIAQLLLRLRAPPYFRRLEARPALHPFLAVVVENARTPELRSPRPAYRM